MPCFCGADIAAIVSTQSKTFLVYKCVASGIDAVFHNLFNKLIEGEYL